MPLPQTVQPLIDDALAAVRAHPDHEMGWQRRKAIYDAFKAVDPKIGQKAYGWWAGLAARRVLPIWENGVPEPYAIWRPEARKWLKWAQKVLRDRANLRKVSMRLRDMHILVGNMVQMIYDDGLSNESIGCALHAAYFALCEACGG